jgi:hypothetical protein
VLSPLHCHHSGNMIGACSCRHKCCSVPFAGVGLGINICCYSLQRSNTVPSKSQTAAAATVLILLLQCMQGYFCYGTLQNAVPEVFLRRTQARTVFQNLLFPGINITNTSSSLTEFWFTMCSGTYSLQKNRTYSM